MSQEDFCRTWELVKDHSAPITDEELLEKLLERFPEVYVSELQELPENKPYCERLDEVYLGIPLPADHYCNPVIWDDSRSDDSDRTTDLENASETSSGEESEYWGNSCSCTTPRKKKEERWKTNS